MNGNDALEKGEIQAIYRKKTKDKVEEHFVAWGMFRYTFSEVRAEWKLIILTAVSILSISFLEFSIPQMTKAIIDEMQFPASQNNDYLNI
ncbi:hypothetical protein M3650_02150 [Paenibacillus sp. MER TA 81-3]|nr:hypothetical protein [Paenibacillus sp. MER TA 81-3]